jgi:hypothetical protein
VAARMWTTGWSWRMSTKEGGPSHASPSSGRVAQRLQLSSTTWVWLQW